MNYYDWKKIIVSDYQQQRQADMRQFGIHKIDDTNNIGKKLICTNIFGTNSNEMLNNIINSEENTAIIIGFGRNNNLHLGHLLLSNEISFYLKNVKHPIFYFVNFESDNNISFIKQIERFGNNYEDNMKYEIIDYKNFKAIELKRKIAELLNINTINRVMGWNNVNMIFYEKTLDMITTFALANILNERQSIVLTDINQKTYYALFKTIENKINTKDICFVYHLLLPSLKSPVERMSISKEKSSIRFNDSEDEIINKLKKCYTGIESKEKTCLILRIADLVLKNDETLRMVNKCIDAENYCSFCKEKNIRIITKELIKRKNIK